MKTLTLTVLLSLTSLSFANAQHNEELKLPYIGQNAPSFKAESTMGLIRFPDDFYNKWRIIFSHPGDFTPVCTSEILSLAAAKEKFDKLNTALIIVSTDGLNSHIEWIKSMEAIAYNNTGSVKIEFPLVSDASLEISTKYGMLNKEKMNKKDLRSVFIIDAENKIRAMNFYPDNVGRNIDELIRMVEALQTADKHNVLTPADWKSGEKVLIPSPTSVDDAQKLRNRNNGSLQEVTWYMWFKIL